MELLKMQILELRFRVKRVDVTRPAFHHQEYATRRLGGKVAGLRASGPADCDGRLSAASNWLNATLPILAPRP